MNKNSKQRVRAQREANKEAGFRDPGFKRKAKSFPRPNEETTLSMREQRDIFNMTADKFKAAALK